MRFLLLLYIKFLFDIIGFSITLGVGIILTVIGVVSLVLYLANFIPERLLVINLETIKSTDV